MVNSSNSNCSLTEKWEKNVYCNCYGIKPWNKLQYSGVTTVESRNKDSVSIGASILLDLMEHIP